MDFRDYLRAIKEGLFANQEQMKNRFRQKETPPEVRPASWIVEDLCAIKGNEWAIYAFSREPLNGKFDDTARYELTEKALACGDEMAVKYMDKLNSKDSVTLADRLGLNVEYPEIPQSTARVLFAEFVEPKNIYIFQDGTRRGATLLAEPDVKAAFGGPVNIPSILLSHEIFHFVEREERKTIWTKSYRIDLWAPPLFKNRSRVAVLSEIAAMGFAKRLAGIDFSPYVMDAFLVYGYSPQAASALYEEMMRFAGRTPRSALEKDEPQI